MKKDIKTWLALALQLIPKELENDHKLTKKGMYNKGYNRAIREAIENINKFLQ